MNTSETSPNQQMIEDLNLEWLEEKWGKFSGSNMISLMADVDSPELLGKTKLAMVHEVLPDLKDNQKSKTDGSPLVGPLSKLLGWDITGPQAKYAFKQLNPQPDGLKTYAEKVGVQTITRFTPDPELTKPWIIRGKEEEVPAIQKLSIVLDMDFENIGHLQQFILDPEADDFGVTPDGLVTSGGEITMPLEGKCPDSTTHLKYRKIKDAATLREIEPRYYWQVQSQMKCTNTEKALFFSYDDRFLDESKHLHFCYIERVDADIKKIEGRLEMARTWRDAFIHQHIG